MVTRLKIKLAIIAAIILASIYFIYPTIVFYTTKDESTKRKLLPKVLHLGLDLKGGMHLVLELDETKLPKDEKIEDAMDRTIEIIRNRVDQFGIAEPSIVKQGKKWINVQLPGVKDPVMAKELIGKTALLEFRLVDETNSIERIVSKMRELGISTSEVLTHNEILPLIPTGYVLLRARDDTLAVVKSSAELTGAYLVNAKVEIGGDFGLPVVSLEFNKEGARIFSRVTEANINRNLAIVLDDVVQSAPVIRERIPDGRAQIEGNFRMEEARFLATVLRAGALPTSVNIIEERTVGPTLGEDLIRSGMIAFVVAFIAVSIFMITYYKFSGIIAILTLFLNVFILLSALSMFKATLTLAGIAGIILLLGISVDANILIFERIKEELKAKKTLAIAIDTGYSKAFATIFDANLTTIIAAAFLFQFGTGPVRGFAITLTLGLIINMLTAVFFTKTVYDTLLVTKSIPQIKYLL